MRINQIARLGPNLLELQCCSPWLSSQLRPDMLIDLLFPGNPEHVLICAGRALACAETRTKQDFYGDLRWMQFIVPNPMKSMRGQTKLNTPSFRTLDNTSRRRFLVVECDPMAWKDLPSEAKALFGTEWDYKRIKRDECAAVIWYLSQIAPRFPLVMVVNSSGKSLHAWFFVEGADENEIRDFFRNAVALGADPMTWTPCQFVRMPGGLRDTGRRQQVVYFNSHALKSKISPQENPALADIDENELVVPPENLLHIGNDWSYREEPKTRQRLEVN
jgi:hypothetical protein